MPHNAKIHYNYANFLKDVDRQDEAITHYRETVRLDPTYTSAYNNLGTLLDDPREKMFNYFKTLDLNPTHVGAHINLGTIYLKLNNVTESLRHLRRAVNLDNKNMEALLAFAWTLMESGDYVEAEVYMRTALEVQANHIQGHIQYGELMKRMDRHEEAIQHFKTAFDLDQTANAPLVFAAHSLSHLGDTQQAENLMKRAVAIRRDVDTLEQMAVMYARWGRQQESLTLYEEVGQMTDNSTEILFRHAKVLANAGKLDEAEALMTEVLQRDEHNIEAILTQGRILCEKEHYEQGLQLFNKGIEYSERTGTLVTDDTLFERGNCYRAAGKQREAIQDFKAVLKFNPNHMRAHSNIGTIYHMHDNIERAKFHYAAALRLNPANSIVKENMKKLQRMLDKKPRTGG